MNEAVDELMSWTMVLERCRLVVVITSNIPAQLGPFSLSSGFRRGFKWTVFKPTRECAVLNLEDRVTLGSTLWWIQVRDKVLFSASLLTASSSFRRDVI